LKCQQNNGLQRIEVSKNGQIDKFDMCFLVKTAEDSGDKRGRKIKENLLGFHPGRLNRRTKENPSD